MPDAYDAIDPAVLAELKASRELRLLRDAVRTAYAEAGADPDLGERGFWAGLAIAYSLGLRRILAEFESMLPKEAADA